MAISSLVITFILIEIASCLDFAPKFLDRGLLIKCDTSKPVDMRKFFPADKDVGNVYSCYCPNGHIECKRRSQDEEQPVALEDQGLNTTPSTTATNQDHQKTTTSLTECDCKDKELEQDAGTEHELTTYYVDGADLVTHPIASRAKYELQKLDLHGSLHVIPDRKRYVKHKSFDIRDDKAEELDREGMHTVTVVLELGALFSIACLAVYFRDHYW